MCSGSAINPIIDHIAFLKQISYIEYHPTFGSTGGFHENLSSRSQFQNYAKFRYKVKIIQKEVENTRRSHFCQGPKRRYYPLDGLVILVEKLIRDLRFENLMQKENPANLSIFPENRIDAQTVLR